LSLIHDTAPDFIVFQEVSDSNRPILDQLRDAYPFQIDCPLDSNLGEAVLSRHPSVAGTGFCSGRDGLAAMQVRTPNGLVWAASVHLSWPWPKGQAAQVDQILPDVARLSGPAVMAGDFNAAAWSHTVSRMGAASGTQRRGPYRASFHLPALGWPVGLDHVLASSDFSTAVRRMPKAGSDHHGSLTFLEWRHGG
jgi:endonuclease/exonuclease/phosphatase (EEP) superfamily protein YafD